MDFVVKIIDLPQSMATVHAQLFDDKNASEGNVVLVNIMTKDLLEDAPILQTRVKDFVPGPRSIHGELMLKVFGLSLSDDLWIPAITGVGNNMLTWFQLLLQNGTKDVQIRPCITFKRTTERHDITCSNADTNLIAQTRSIELVRVPFLFKRKLLQDFKVNSINGHQSTFILVIAEAILPDNLR